MKTQYTVQDHIGWLIATVILCINLLLGVPVSAEGTPVVLIDFGETPAGNSYGAQWQQEIVGPRMEHVAVDGHTGTRMTAGTDKWDNYQGVRGTTALSFQEGDEIRVTWYNSSTQTMRFSRSTPCLVSFEDLDNPVDQQGEPQWYWMTHTTREAGPGEQFETVYVITSERTQEGNGTIVPTNGEHTSINVSLSQSNPEIICEQIEYVPAEAARPEAPTLTMAKPNATYPSAQVDLSWNAVSSPRGVDYYKIYRNGIYVNRTQKTDFTDAPLESGKAYTYTVTAIDIVNPGFQTHDTLNSNVNESKFSAPMIVSTADVQRQGVIDPQEEIEYMGAFKLTGPRSGTSRWGYRKGSIAFYPPGDPENQDNFPGSLYGWGHIYHDSVAEVAIPEPVISKNWDDLNAPKTLQAFHAVRPDGYDGYGSKSHQAITYIPLVDTFYTIFANSYNVSYKKDQTHASFRPDFSNIAGKWWIGEKTQSGDPHYYSYVNFLFGAPLEWAHNNGLNEKILISGGSRTGPCRRGPGLIAIQPWSNDGFRSQPAPAAELDFAKLVYYGEYSSSAYLYHPNDQLRGWIEGDGWVGGAWLETDDKSAVIVSGSKALGEYYYGDTRGVPRAHQGMYVPNKLTGKGGANTSRQSMMIFYDPEELAEIARGEREPWDIQPYTSLVVDDYLLKENLHNAATGGSLRGVTYDKENGLIYAVESRVTGPSEPQDAIHVFKVGAGVTPEKHTLRVNKKGAGNGTITSSPSGINCGEDCAADFSEGSSVTLTAIPADGAVFEGWSGACSGTETTCQVNIETDTHISAMFKVAEVNVVMAKSGSAADIRAACSLAKAGDVIQIPAGTFNFSSKSHDDVYCDAGITIKGAGQGKTVLKSNGLYSGMLRINGTNGLPFTFSEITWEGPGGGLNIDSCKDFLVINSTFKNVKEGPEASNSHGAIKVGGDSNGVIAHCQFLYDENAPGHSYGVAVYDNPESWDKPLELGTADAVFIEDCYFDGGEGFKHAIASNNGAKYVFRHNTLKRTVRFWAHLIDVHGTMVPRGSRSYEIYENVFLENHDKAMNIRGGDGVIFNNVVIGSIILSNEATWGKSDCQYPCGDQTTDMYIWGNTQPDGELARFGVWDYNLQEGRDYYRYEKPGYTPYTYPHPLVSGTPLPDTDLDGIPDTSDNCPLLSNPNQADSDRDGTGDACDQCVNDPEKIAPGSCGCGVADTDSDNDGVLDCQDNCPETFNPSQLDSDRDGVGAACETPSGELLITRDQTPKSDRGGPASRPAVQSGDTLTYSTSVTNLFEEAISLMISDSLNALVDFVAGTFSVNGELSSDFSFSDEGFLQYEHDLLAPNDSLQIAFEVVVSDEAIAGSIIGSSALVTAWYFGAPDPLAPEKSNLVEAQVTEPVPEPSTIGILGLGLCGLLLFVRRRREGNFKGKR